MAVGLDEFDADAAAQGVGDVYRQAQELAAPEQGGSEPGGAHNPDTAGSTPAPATQLPYGLNDIPPPPSVPGFPGVTRTIRQDILSPEQVANQAEQRRITGEGADLTQRQGDLGVEQAKIEQGRAEAEQEHLQKRQQLISDAVKLGETHIDEARTAYREAVESRSGMKLSDPWSNMTTGSRIMALIGVALGGLGSGARGRNDALDILQSNIKQDLDLQRANIASADDRVAMLRAGVRDAQEAKSRLLSDVDVNEAAVWKAIEAKWRADLAARKVPAAEIDRDARVLAAQKAAADAEAKALAPTVRHVQDTLTNMVRGKLRTGGGGGRGGAEAKLAGMAEQGRPLSEIQAEAARLGVKGDTARKIVAAVGGAEGRSDRAEAAEDARVVYDPATGDALGRAPDKERAKIATASLLQLHNISNDMRLLREHIASQGTVAPMGLTEASRERNTRAFNLVTSMSGFKGLGAISSDDRKILDNIVTGGVPYVLGLNAKQLDTMLGAVARARESQLRSQGIKASGTAPAGKSAPAAASPPAAKDPRIDLARRAVKSANATPAQKANAAAFLKSVGEEP